MEPLEFMLLLIRADKQRPKQISRYKMINGIISELHSEALVKLGKSQAHPYTRAAFRKWSGSYNKPPRKLGG